MVMMTAYVLWPTLKRQNKTTKINEPLPKPTNKTNPQKTHKKTQHKQTKPTLKTNHSPQQSSTHKKEKDPGSAEISAFCEDYLFF